MEMPIEVADNRVGLKAAKHKPLVRKERMISRMT